MAVYLGGSRSQSISQENHIAVLRAVANSGEAVHVGCQLGVDQSVVNYFTTFAPSSLVVFAVAPNPKQAPRHIAQLAYWVKSVTIVFSAGGESAPIPARYLLRSIAAFQGCECAVFFQPGSGSLAVAREFAKTSKPIFAFGEKPAPIPHTAGAWFASEFKGFPCWLWSYSQLSFI